MNCKICGKIISNPSFGVKERMLNEGDEFGYAECQECGTLQLVEDIDVSRFYEGYYSFYEKSNGSVRNNKFIEWFVVNTSIFAWLDGMPKMIHIPNGLLSLRATKVKKNSKILDVGGGNGCLANDLARIGYGNILTIDRFCDHTEYDIPFKQCQINELNDESGFDLVMFNNSFEHMCNPVETLKAANRILKNRGICVLRIPVSGNIAYKKYKENWFQIDAPRHYFLFTKKAINFLASQTGFKIKKDWCCAGCDMFTMSEAYRDNDSSWKDILNSSPFRHYCFTKKIAIYLMTIYANITKQGDSACFILEKKD